MSGWVYILECSDGSYYTGSTRNLTLRLQQHQAGLGANHTKKRLPVKLLYAEEYSRVQQAFYREKQIQKWSRAKKEALMAGDLKKLHQLASCQNDTHYLKSIKSLDEYAASVEKPEDSSEAAPEEQM